MPGTIIGPPTTGRRQEQSSDHPPPVGAGNRDHQHAHRALETKRPSACPPGAGNKQTIGMPTGRRKQKDPTMRRKRRPYSEPEGDSARTRCAAVLLGNEAFGVDLIGFVWKDSAVVTTKDMAFGSTGSPQLLADRPAALDVALGSFRSLAVISKQTVKGFCQGEIRAENTLSSYTSLRRLQISTGSCGSRMCRSACSRYRGMSSLWPSRHR